jgi:hypothetical protein
MVTDMLNVAYVIIKDSIDIRIVNGFPSDPIVIFGIIVHGTPMGTHLHAFQCLPHLAYLLLHRSPKLLKFRSRKRH